MKQTKRSLFVCQNCGQESAKWLGRCPSCNSWNSFVEEIRIKTKESRRSSGTTTQPVLLSKVPLIDKLRQPTRIKELDQVLGGGIVPGSIILIGGEPGIGKSTLTMQIANNITGEKDKSVLYVSGEESIEQIKLRSERLAVKNENIYLLAENELENILAQIDALKPSLVIIDSIQAIYSDNLSSSPGSVGQVRECTAEILRRIKGEQGIKPSVIIIGHITKFGAIAGPKTLEHIVDVVLYFEGDKFQQYRVLRATKNRFGSTQEIGIFEMSDSGLVGVDSPSLLFISHTQAKTTTKTVGSVVIPTIEGTRPILLEVQALAAPSYFNFPQRVTTGLDIRRLAMLLCVLERHCGMNIGNHDIFLNTSGGLKITEPGGDLGVACAIASTYRNKPITSGIAIVGEVSLSGEIRPVVQMKNRINECAKMGFNQIIGPNYTMKKEIIGKANIKTIGVTTVSEALEVLGIR
jgi:DNA repair protein RadA/Sms